ncbi:hypothetical protein Poly30_08870 [Planctomycetes bacterium Poly30]|uniref:Uncharacterized protein n=1 Tax=Saltatorellus ferox TaxID=2528018 RepID=A0A518EMS6_9BACT|nr:hypothetical protein Poly30_08870 [Planctomycetes bacterium Poly30]
MKTKPIRLALALALSLALIEPPLHAQHTVLWEAASGFTPAETVPSWTRYEAASTCSAVTEDLQPTYLELGNSSSCPDDLLSYYSVSPGLLPVPPGSIYRAETRMQVVASGDVDPEHGVGFLALLQPYTCPWILEIERDSVSFYHGSELGATVLMDTTNAMHDYRLEGEAGSFEGRAYVDDQLIGTITTTSLFCGQFGQTAIGALFGQSVANEPGITRWESATHNAGPARSNFCTQSPAPNSLGLTGWITPLGSLEVADNDFRLHATGIPVGSFGYFLCSTDWSGAVPLVGSQGALCLGGSVGRFNRPGEILIASSQTMMLLDVDLTGLPQPTGAVAAQSGDTWHFQLWYRDANPLPTSNLSNAVQLHFR